MSDKKTFGQRCADSLLTRKIIIAEDYKETAEVIDFERAEVIRRTTLSTTPGAIDHSDPRLAGTKAEEDFGDRKKIPPTPEQVAAYTRSIGTEIDGHAFFDHYQSKGWVVGRTKMKDWQAAARRAIRENYFTLRTAKPAAAGSRKFY